MTLPDRSIGIADKPREQAPGLESRVADAARQQLARSVPGQSGSEQKRRLLGGNLREDQQLTPAAESAICAHTSPPSGVP